MSRHSRPCRPTREQRSAKALGKIDVDAVDHVRVIKELCADPTQPGSTRLAAAKALARLQQLEIRAAEIAAGRAEKAVGGDPAPRPSPADDINRRALKWITNRGREN